MEENTMAAGVVVLLLLGVLTVVSWVWYGRKMAQDTVEEARRIRLAQGEYEAEINCGGEADLYRHYQRCDKNPGHKRFIQLQKFNIEHLPPGYRDNVIMNWIRSEADLTCFLSVQYTATCRPKFVPGTQVIYPSYKDRSREHRFIRTGTGWVQHVDKYTENDWIDCECAECTSGTHAAKKVWAKFTVYTACHLVFNSKEARHTKCIFGYDTAETRIKECHTLRGLRAEYSDIEKDVCVMTCVTHDVELMKKLLKMESNRVEMRKKVMNKNGPSMNKGLSDPSVSYLTDPPPCPVVIISHPHGCNKQLTFGEWTGRDKCGETPKRKGDDWEYDYMDTRYTYNADTCHGSSGAPVIRLMDPQRWWMGADYHPHSKGTGNNNKSGVVPEIVSPPTPSQEMLINKILSDSKQARDNQHSYRQESDLIHHFRRCAKNPGHSRFVPVQDFKKEHLPPGYRDNDIVDWIRAEADLTCRLRMTHTSKNRPKHWPGRPHSLYPFSPVRRYCGMRTATGFVSRVYKYTEEDNKLCECRECTRHTPHKVWGKVCIGTTCHVIHDDDEARHTTCHFGYDTIKTWLSDCLKFTGLNVKRRDIVGDWCVVTYVTHDMDKVNTLYKMDCHREALRQKLTEKYRSDLNKSLVGSGVSYITDPKPGVVAIISHPHGLTKYITLGLWNNRQTWSETKKLNLDGWESDYVVTSYTYNAHTCPGSSGAPLFRLPEKGRVEWRWSSAWHVHSAGGEDNTNNNNTSAVWVEFISPLTRSVASAAQLNESIAPPPRSVSMKALLNELVSFLIRFVKEKTQLKEFVSFLTRSVEKTVLLQKFVIFLTRSVDKKAVLDVFVSSIIKSEDNEAQLDEFVSFLIKFMAEKAQLGEFFSFLTRSMADESHLDEIVSFLTRSVNNLVVD